MRAVSPYFQATHAVTTSTDHAVAHKNGVVAAIQRIEVRGLRIRQMGLSWQLCKPRRRSESSRLDEMAHVRQG